MASFGMMGALAGFGGALVNQGERLGKQEDADLQMERDKKLQSWLLQAREEYAVKAEGRAEERAIASEGRADTRTIAGEQRGMTNRAAERGAIVDETVANAPRLRDVKAADRKAEKMVEYDPEVTGARIGAEETSARSKAKVEREGMIASGNDPQYVAALRRLSQAKHVEGLGSVMQAELAKLGIEEKKKVGALYEQYENSTDPKEKAAIKDKLTLRGIIKTGEFDTEQVATTTLDKDGNEIKTTRTQRRGAGVPTGGAQDVKVDGKVIGRASSVEEAKRLVEQHKKAPSAAPAPAVPGRPLYNAPLATLKRLANKPNGVSTDEANQARAELQARQGESRMSTF